MYLCLMQDLTKDLKSELGGRFEDVVVAMMTPHFDYLARRLNKAISGVGTKEKSLVDILCTATNQEIREINNAYYRCKDISFCFCLSCYINSSCFAMILITHLFFL